MISKRNSLVLCVLLIVILNGISFSPVLEGNFLNWDDEENVVFAENLRKSPLRIIGWVFTDFTVGDFKPLAWISYVLDYFFWRLNPVGYHLGNLLLHCASAVTVFFLFLAQGRRFTKNGGGVIAPALTAALFFSLSPLRTESVAWISERKDVLCAFFYLAAVLAYLDYNRKKGVFPYVLTLVLAGLALLSKPMAVTIPIALLLVDVLGGGKGSIFKFKEKLKEKIPFFLLAAATGLAAFFGQMSNRALLSLSEAGGGERLLAAVRIPVFYLGKIVLPFNLSASYPRLPISAAVSAAAAAVILVTITVASLRQRIRGVKGYLFWWLWFIILLIPVGGVFPAGLVSVADRFTYLPSVGVAGIIFILLCRFRRQRGFITAGAGLIVVFLMLLSFRQSQKWHDSRSLWESTVRATPVSPVARAHLGQILYEQGEDRRAAGELQTARRLLKAESTSAGAGINYAVSTNLARVLGRLDRPEEGVRILEELLAVRSDWMLHFSLGELYRDLGERERAADHYRRTLAARPGFVPALCQYGLLRASAGDPGGAVELYRRALAIAPDSPRARYNLSLAFLDQGKPEEALKILTILGGEYPANPRLAAARSIARRLSEGGEVSAGELILLGERTRGAEKGLPYSKKSRPDVLIPIR